MGESQTNYSNDFCSMHGILYFPTALMTPHSHLHHHHHHHHHPFPMTTVMRAAVQSSSRPQTRGKLQVSRLITLVPSPSPQHHACIFRNSLPSFPLPALPPLSTHSPFLALSASLYLFLSACLGACCLPVCLSMSVYLSVCLHLSLIFFFLFHSSHFLPCSLFASSRSCASFCCCSSSVFSLPVSICLSVCLPPYPPPPPPPCLSLSLLSLAH